MPSETVVENTPESEFEHAKELYWGLSWDEQQKTVHIFEKLAAQGHSEACYALGCLANQSPYSGPIPGQEDTKWDTYWFTKAFELFKKEAEGGNLKSRIYLAEMYERGCGTKKDSEKSSYWKKTVFEECLKRAEAGDTEKQLAVAKMYQIGCFTERNPEKAVFWYDKYSEHADAEELYRIASVYLHRGLGYSEKNIEKAEKLLLRCAETADAELLRNIGMAFTYSDIKKPEMGLKLIQKSAENGSRMSKVFLACMYMTRHERTQDICTMREYLSEALDSNNRQVQNEARCHIYNISKYYQDRADYYLERARGGYNCAAAFRTVLRLLFWNPDNPLEEVFSLLKEITSVPDINQSLAEFILGCLYEKGIGTRKDDKTAAKWFIRAAEHNYVHAQLAAGALYLKGIGVEKDPEKAAYWLKKISDPGDTMTDAENPFYAPSLLNIRINDDPNEDRPMKENISRILSMRDYVDIVMPWFIQEAEKGNAGAQKIIRQHEEQTAEMEHKSNTSRIYSILNIRRSFSI